MHMTIACRAHNASAVVGSRKQVYQVAWSPDGSMLATTCNNDACVWFGFPQNKVSGSSSFSPLFPRRFTVPVLLELRCRYSHFKRYRPANSPKLCSIASYSWLFLRFHAFSNELAPKVFMFVLARKT